MSPIPQTTPTGASADNAASDLPTGSTQPTLLARCKDNFPLLPLSIALTLIVSASSIAFAEPLAAVNAPPTPPTPPTTLDLQPHEGLSVITTGVGMGMLIGGALLVLLIGWVCARNQRN